MRSSCVALSKIELIQAHKEDDTKRKKVRAMNKMTVAAALAALAVGAAAGWSAAGAWGGEAGTAEFAETLRAVGDVVSGDMAN